MKFEDKLIKLRKEKGLSQEELGNEINVSRQAVSKWESGQVKPEMDKIKELSSFFDVTTDYLIKDEIEEKESKPKKQKNILKIIKIILLLVVTLYLITVIYKYVVLAMCVRKINNIEDYNEYKILTMNIMNDKEVTNDVIKMQTEIIYRDGISCSKHYTNTKAEKNGDLMYFDYSSNLNVIPEMISYENEKKGINYTLNYDYELEKYIYNDLSKDEFGNREDVGVVSTIKDIAQYEIGDYLMIFGISINPISRVSIYNDRIEIYEKYKGGYINKVIDKYTGFIIETKSVINDSVVMLIQYDYEVEDIDDLEIKEPNVEYVMAEEVYGE